MGKLRRIVTLITGAAVLTGMCASAPVVSAENTGDTVTVTADKTAQWTNQELSAGYDLKIHGWSTWETAAYIGFTLPEDFTSEGLTRAELVLDTTEASAGAEAYIYEADYNSFTSGAQYEGTANAPSYTAQEFNTFTSPSSAGTTSINITKYIKGLAGDAANAAFRIDVKSQDLNGFKWTIGSLTNGGAAPQLVFTYDSENMSFSEGMAGWTAEGGAEAGGDEGETYADIPAGGKVSRVITGLENGSYNLKVQSRRPDLNESCYVYVKSDGQPINKSSASGNNTWRETVIQGIEVTDGKCEIGFCGKGQFTNVRLEKAETASRSEFLVGGDITEVSYVESCGGKYYDEEGNQADPIQLLAERGFNFARVRVYNDPGRGHGETSSWKDENGNVVSETYYLPEGFQNVEDGLSLSKRAKDKGMQVELTLYFSDYWADGARQMIPHEWAEEIEELPDWNAKYARLKELMYEFTKDVLLKMKAQDTLPEYISLGNEMQGGLLYDAAGTYDYGRTKNFGNLAGLLNSAAQAVREVAPDTKIVLHLDGKRSQYQSFFDNCEKYNVDYDIIGPSYYPFWTDDTVDTVVGFYNWLIERYDKDILVMETGYNFNPEKASGGVGQLQDNGPYNDVYPSSPQGQRAFMEEVFQGLRSVSGGRCIGDLYWDPMMINQEGVGWAMVEGADGAPDYAGDNLISNTTLFDFNGRALPAFDAYKNSGYTPGTVGIGGRITGVDGVPFAEKTVNINVNDRVYSVNTDKMGGYFMRVPYADTLTVAAADSAQQPYSIDMREINLKTGLDFAIEDKVDNTNTITFFSANEGENGVNYKVGYSSDKEDSDLYVALYDENGAMIGCRMNSAEGSIAAELEAGKSYTVKAFLWNSMEPADMKSDSFVCDDMDV